MIYACLTSDFLTQRGNEWCCVFTGRGLLSIIRTEWIHIQINLSRDQWDETIFEVSRIRMKWWSQAQHGDASITKWKSIFIHQWVYEFITIDYGNSIHFGWELARIFNVCCYEECNSR